MAARSTFRALRPRLGLPLAAALSLLGCDSVDSAAEHTIAQERMARPAAIVVQPFALSPDAVAPSGAAAAGASNNEAEQAAQKFRASLADHLVTAIRAMGLPAVSADAPLPPAGNVVSLEGTFTSVPGDDSAEPAIVTLADSWPDVVLDVQIYDATSAEDRLLEDMEFQLSDTEPLIPREESPPEPTIPQSGGTAQHAITPAIQAKLDAAARDGAAVIAGQLRPFFADQGWIAAAGS
ncbi:MAG TPA: DUF4410 domain-containing protein [Geminicoccaceae bacterium]|nr:DUF4410 domain-containing protein [Geminicoccaceae bacterium]